VSLWLNQAVAESERASRVSARASSNWLEYLRWTSVQSQDDQGCARRRLIGGSFEGFSATPCDHGSTELSLTTAALGFRVEHDTRDSMFYPTRGIRMDARADFFGPYIGSGFTFQNYVFEINKHITVCKGHVVALRAMGCGVAGEQIPFCELCRSGIMGDLRGHQTGCYRDRAMFPTQGEWHMILL
jgi:outer membrane protein assembly factor BamA